MYSNLSKQIIAPKNMTDYVKLVEAHVKVRIISEIKKYIDCGTIEQEKLSDISNRELIIEVLQKLICDVWDELEINISNIMLEKNLLMAMEIYNYLTPDFKLLSMNYNMNRNDLDFDQDIQKNILLNTIDELREKIKYIDDEELKNQFIDSLNVFEYKVCNYENSRQLTEFLKAMKKSKIHMLMSMDESGEKLIYPDIIDMFKDYYYLLYVFYLDEDRIERLKRNLKNNQNRMISPMDNDLLIQLGIANRNQVSSYLRSAYDENTANELGELHVIFRQMFEDTVNNHRAFSSSKFENVSSYPLPLSKYRLLCTG